MKAPKSMTGIFNDLARNRNAARTATHTHGVYRICKNGQPAKTPSSTQPSQEAAEKQAARMTRINPGMTFIVKEL